MMMSLFLAAYFALAAQTEGRTARIVAAPDSPVRLESASVLNSGSAPLVLLYPATKRADAPSTSSP